MRAQYRLHCIATTPVKPEANDLRNLPAYSIAEASRYLRLPSATLRSWFVGRSYPTAKQRRDFAPLIDPSNTKPLQLSFWNMIEAHVLRALRVDHSVSIRSLREAIQFAEQKLEIEHLLLSRELRTSAGQVFLDKYGQLINLSASGQIAMRRLLEEHLNRVEWDQWQFPVRLYPFGSSGVSTNDRHIAIDPTIAFGRPVILSKGISTRAITDRLDAGETVDAVAADYDLTPAEIEEAILYERAA